MQLQGYAAKSDGQLQALEPKMDYSQVPAAPAQASAQTNQLQGQVKQDEIKQDLDDKKKKPDEPCQQCLAAQIEKDQDDDDDTPADPNNQFHGVPGVPNLAPTGGPPGLRGNASGGGFQGNIPAEGGSQTFTPQQPSLDQSGGGGGGGGWSVPEVKKIIAKTDPEVLREICSRHVKIFAFDTAYDTWRYDDGHVERVELRGLMGNTKKDVKEIRLRASLSNQEAAATLFHELMGHMVNKAGAKGLQEEINARVLAEGFRVRQHMPPTQKDYQTPDGKVNRAGIEKSLQSGPLAAHYNPQGRQRIGREYVGDNLTSGWCPP